MWARVTSIAAAAAAAAAVAAAAASATPYIHDVVVVAAAAVSIDTYTPFTRDVISFPPSAKNINPRCVAQLIILSFRVCVFFTLNLFFGSFCPSTSSTNQCPCRFFNPINRRDTSSVVTKLRHRDTTTLPRMHVRTPRDTFSS